MKKNAIILVDGENISAKRAKEIADIGKRWRVIEWRVYHHRKDPATRNWSDQARSKGYRDIGLDGAPAKNKVDYRMQREARRYMEQPELDTVCIATSDAGFRCLAEDADAAGKKLCFIGEKKAPARLRRAADRFFELS